MFGIKGGAAGGGYSQVIPMEDFNLHLTGDVHAIGAAHNLAGAFLDNSLHHKNPLGIDPHGILWPRVVDISDRALRHVVIGLGGREDGIPRETEFVITVGVRGDGGPRARDGPPRSPGPARPDRPRDPIGRRSRSPPRTSASPARWPSCSATRIKPNLLQTLEGGPAFVHAGPFANIAHGNNSIIADRLALATNEIVCTEAGFGADMGAEKFFDIKCRASGLAPDAAVVVATVRALKMHGGVGKIVAGKPLDPALARGERRGGPARCAEPRQADRERHDVRRSRRSWRSTRSRPTRPPRSRRSARWRSRPAHATRWSPRISSTAARVRRHLAEAVWAATHDGAADFRLLYPDEMPLAEKIETHRRPASTAAAASSSCPRPASRSSSSRTWATASLPICMAKTQYSLSHDAALKSRPTGFTRPDPRGPAVRRRRLHHRPVRRDADDARAAVTPGRREDRHRRRREHRRAVLEDSGARRGARQGRRRGRRPAASLRSAPWRPRSRRRSRADDDAESPGAPGCEVDRAQGLLAMGVVVMAVIAAVIVGRVMRDGTLVTGSVVRGGGWVIAGSDLRPAFWQEPRPRRAPLDSPL